jgi:type I restriction enzyme M protein
MAVKKSDLYSSIWETANQLRGGMDASQYKDYVLAVLFIKYISDKYKNDPYAAIDVPEGASFADMVKLKGTENIGDDINKKIIGKIQEANKSLATISFADFDDSSKLGTDKEKITKLTNLIALFEKPELDFSKNKANDDDILGDAYEYLMRHFATESGKSKGQFYTPSEVSLIMALIIGITPENSTNNTSAYDPTSGSGSLLLKIGEQAEKNISLFGQEMDVTTAGLAKMNMILHNNPQAKIAQGNTLANPQFLDGDRLQTFDYSVSNPPFSYSSWTAGVNVINDLFGRFTDYGTPPEKNGDYAFLLHIIKSLKSTGKGAIVLPHGVLFRGGAEGRIRENILKQGFIKGIIGLPANLFYGTGIPACIIVIDKENAAHRKGVFFIDASKGFIKDGNKNRLRDQDVHKIVDAFNKQLELPKYSRMVAVTEIEGNDYNLNIPRYIDAQEAEDTQDIFAHLKGGIPEKDIDALSDYWAVYPSLKNDLFEPSNTNGYLNAKMAKNEIKTAIFSHPEFITYAKITDEKFGEWANRNINYLKNFTVGYKPKRLINLIGNDILSHYSSVMLVNKYDVYQHLMNFWNETMQDDCYLISADGWVADYVYDYKKKQFDSDLLPKQLVINRYFDAEQKAIEKLEADKEITITSLQELEEENSGEEGYFAAFDKVNKITVAKRLKDILASKPKPKKQNLPMAAEDEVAYGEQGVMETYLKLTDQQADLTKKLKAALIVLEEKIAEKYEKLTETEIKQLVVEDKWITTIQTNVKGELDRISQRLTQRLTELVTRYEKPMPVLANQVNEYEQKVAAHLQKMGFSL